LLKGWQIAVLFLLDVLLQQTPDFLQLGNEFWVLGLEVLKDL
jgi:hypothetical protein